MKKCGGSLRKWHMTGQYVGNVNAGEEETLSETAGGGLQRKNENPKDQMGKKTGKLHHTGLFLTGSRDGR